MIPKQAIQKAIEGGWWVTNFFGLTAEEQHQAEHDAVIDPAFWQALGKVLGWKGYVGETHSACGFSGGMDSFNFDGEEWNLNALKFYDLILTNGDTENFWNDLLTTK